MAEEMDSAPEPIVQPNRGLRLAAALGAVAISALMGFFAHGEMADAVDLTCDAALAAVASGECGEIEPQPCEEPKPEDKPEGKPEEEAKEEDL